MGMVIQFGLRSDISDVKRQPVNWFETGSRLGNRETMSIAKVAELIEMPFGIWTWVGPRSCVRWCSRSPSAGGTFEGDDIRIFPNAIEHHSQWPWCWDFPTCCWSVFWLAGCRSNGVSHSICQWKFTTLAMQPLVNILWHLSNKVTCFTGGHWLTHQSCFCRVTISVVMAYQGWQVFAGWWKNVFSVEKTAMAKILFAGKNSFCHINCQAICKNQAYVRK